MIRPSNFQSTGFAVGILFCLAAFHLPSAAAILRVPGEYTTIQEGLDAAVDGDTVLVADGTYSGPGNRRLDFHGKEVRLVSEGGREACIIDAELQAHGFRFQTGEGPVTVVDGFTIRNGYHHLMGGGFYIRDASPTIRNCDIDNCHAETGGGIYVAGPTTARLRNLKIHGCSAVYGAGVYCGRVGSPEFSDCTIQWNITAYGGGGGIHVTDAAPLIRDSLIHGNGSMYGDAGGIYVLSEASPTVTGCVISENYSDGWGGGVCHRGSGLLTLENNLIFGNSAVEGAGLYHGDETATVVDGCTLAVNEAWDGAGIFAEDGDSLSVTRSIIWANHASHGMHGIQVAAGVSPSVSWSDVQDGWPGTGNIDADPLFAEGPPGGYCLSQTAAGQTTNSPCLDAGDPAGVSPRGTTRTDGLADRDVADLGWHHRVVELVAGPGPARDGIHPPLVRGFPAEQDAVHAVEFAAYGGDRYGVNLACGDIDGNGTDKIITGAGPGAIYGPYVRVFTHQGIPLPGLSFQAYGTPRWGVNVAAGDLNGDGTDEIVTGSGPGPVFGPHVRGFSCGDGTVSPLAGVNYFAYGTLRWGVNVACGDIDGDGVDEIVTGAGPGDVFGPHVRGWNVDGGTATALPAVSFFAYGTLRYGVNVACGDLDGDGIDEIATAPGPGPIFGAHIRGWNVDGGAVTPLPGLTFFAWPLEEARFGARIHAGSDLDGDGRDDLLAGGGSDPCIDCRVAAYTYADGDISLIFTLQAFPETWRHGTAVAAGSF